MVLPCATVWLVPKREDISRSKKLGDEASPSQPEGRSTPNREAEATAPAVAEQSVLEPVVTAVAEGRPRGGLVTLLSRISTDPLAVHNAWEDLRSMIEEVVQREVQALEKRIGVEIRAVESKLRSEIGGVAAKLSGVESKLRSEIGALAAKVSGVESGLRSEIGALAAKVSGVAAKVSTVESKLSTVESGLRSEIRAVESRLRSELNALRAEFVMMRWVLGILAASHIALFAVVISMFIFVANDRMDSRREVDPVEQTQGAKLPEPDRVAAEEAAASASGAELEIDTEPTRSPADEDPPEGRDVQ